MTASVALRLSLNSLPVRRRRPVDLASEADRQLLNRVRQRNVQALEVLYDRYAPRALGLAFKILKDRDLAEQVIQDAFWRVWRSAERYEADRGSFSTWLFTIVRNLSIDQLRRRRHVEVPLDDPMQAETIEAHLPTPDVGEQVTRQLDAEQVRSAMQALPEAQRRVLELAYFEGLSRREIAERLEQPLGTIHTRARLGLDKLRVILLRQQQA